MTAPARLTPAPKPVPAPPIARRLAAFVYEGVLLFGLVMLVGLIYGLVTQQRHALSGSTGLQATLFLVLGAYFVHFWTQRGGQTLAMRTWRIRLVTINAAPLRPARATLRYLLAWLWFLPALATLKVAGLKGAGVAFTTLAVGVLAYAALSWLRPDRQFWHDAICGTRLVDGRQSPAP